MIFHEYETIFVSRPELPDEETTRLNEKFDRIIEQYKGAALVVEEWGRRRMAYPIKRHAQGHYRYINYIGPAELPAEIERNIGIEDNMIRFITVRINENVELESSRVGAIERQRQRAIKAAEKDEEPRHNS